VFALFWTCWLVTFSSDVLGQQRICPQRVGDSTSVRARLGHVTVSGKPVEPTAPELPITVFRQQKPVRAQRCMALFENDVVEVLHESATVAIEFPKSIAVLKPMTSMRISSPANDVAEGTGSIWSFFGEIFGFGRLKIQDEYMTAGAEGTSYVVRTFKQGRTTVTVLEGHVRVEPRQAASYERVLEPGQKLAVETSGVVVLGSVGASEVAVELAAFRLLTGYPTWQFAELAAQLDAVAPSNDSASILFEGSKPIDMPRDGALSAQVAWSHLWLRPATIALGSRLLAGGVFGQYRSPMTDPASDREEPPLDGTASLPFHGALAELDAELHLMPRGALGYTFGLGMRGGWSHLRYVEGKSDHFVWGPVLTSRAKWRWDRGYSGLFQLNFLIQRTPVAACPIGCVELAEPRPSVWDVWVGFAIGAEVDL
jgi:hypothetical protein